MAFSRTTGSLRDILVLLQFLLVVALAVDEKAEDYAGCPDSCSCVGKFVSCYEYEEETLNGLSADMDQLILNGGSLRTFPKGFFRRFPLLTFLEIQSAKVDVIDGDTFADMSGMDQLALTDCHVGVIEAGAFHNLTAISQFFISSSTIEAVKSGAFSHIHNIGDFNVWSSQIGKIDQGAFTNLSEISSFAFYLNNVTTMDSGAFADVSHFLTVDIYLNIFESFHGGAVVTLNKATSDMNMYSNTFLCDCGVVQMFRRPTMTRFMSAQKCWVPGNASVLQFPDVAPQLSCSDDLDELRTTSDLVDLFTAASSPTSVSTTISSGAPDLTTTVPNTSTQRPSRLTTSKQVTTGQASQDKTLLSETSQGLAVKDTTRTAANTTLRPSVTSRGTTPTVLSYRSTSMNAENKDLVRFSPSDPSAGARTRHPLWRLIVGCLLIIAFAAQREA